MFKNTDSFSYDIDPNFDFVIDEKANKYMALRKIRWGSSEEYKLDLRNYVATEDGERMLKGCTFISEEAGHELSRVLVEQGYGDTETLADTIIENRPELCGALIDRFENMNKSQYENLKEGYSNPAEEYHDLDDLAEVI